MINVTEQARAKLYSMLMGRGSMRANLRLAMSPSRRLGLVMDKESSGDLAIEHNGVKVLLVGREVRELVEKATLDTRCEDGESVLTMNLG